MSFVIEAIGAATSAFFESSTEELVRSTTRTEADFRLGSRSALGWVCRTVAPACSDTRVMLKIAAAHSCAPGMRLLKSIVLF